MAAPPVTGLAVLERRVESPRASIVCVHGGLDRGGSFARLARRLDDFDVVAFDRRGYQGSRALGVGTLDQHVDDVVALVDAEARRGPVIVFGHSVGGVIAFGAAIREPLAIDLVVAYESPLPWILPREHSRPLLGEDPSEEVEIFFKRMVSRGAWERLSEAEKLSRRLDGPALLADLRAVRSVAPYDLSELDVPSVYAHGDGVLAPYYRELAALLAERFSLGEVEMSGAGHGAHLANPDQLAHLLDALWRDTCASA
jgi:pimeloyl-ACP methyl ester carboxylesterase